MNLSSSTRYMRMARLVFKLPTYARTVWGIMRDPRTPIDRAWSRPPSGVHTCGHLSRTDVLMSNRCGARWYHSEPIPEQAGGLNEPVLLDALHAHGASRVQAPDLRPHGVGHHARPAHADRSCLVKTTLRCSYVRAP